MAGDHKCPVCNSTFTRPQHVARHMRSHTGDRPYKCQHCGDQFARSDLLSRHVNKCHAAEKPPTTTAPNRRKGTAAASRAMTSKQACDQCVQSSLPCDGCNPCSKCVQRKCRCTYVKFHRQTAPQGPGHPPPTAITHQQHRSLGLGGRLDDFALGPDPGSSLQGMYVPGYSLPPMYGANPYADPRQSPTPSLTMSTRSDSIESSPDMMARYRAQAELLSRAGVLPSGTLNGMPPAGQVMPNMYAPQDNQATSLSRYSLSGPSANESWATQSFQAPAAGKNVDGTGYHIAGGQGRQSFPGGGGHAALAAHPPASGAPFSTIQHPGAPQSGASGAYPHASTGLPFAQHHSGQHRRSEELSDDFSSDGGHSVPSSANSSSVHLPIIDQRTGRPYGASESPTIPYQQSDQQGVQRKDSIQSGEVNEGGFSSAFGLMSLDDPNVLAGLANDSAPFFSGMPLGGFNSGENDGRSSSSASIHSNTSQSSSNVSDSSHTTQSSGNGILDALSLATPTPDLLASLRNGGLLSAGGRDALDNKEMKDFWKQYMRTPLTGPGGNTPLFPLQTPTGPGQQLGAPTPTRRHSRVASLPSMKTPPIILEINSFPPNGAFNLNLPRKAQNAQTGDRQGHAAYSNVRTTLHGDAEDLKSYEAAVLARKAPTTLNLVPKRRGTLSGPGITTLGSSSLNNNLSPHQSNLIPNISHSATSGSKISDQRPGSSNGALTDAFSSSNGYNGQAHQSLSHFQHSSSSPQGDSPRESSVDSESSNVSYRPSFKRLASQTLGPPNAKRALLGPAGWDDEDALEDEDSDDLRPGSGGAGRLREFQDHGYSNHGAIRRFSLPASAGIASGGSTLPPIRMQNAPSQTAETQAATAYP